MIGDGKPSTSPKLKPCIELEFIKTLNYLGLMMLALMRHFSLRNMLEFEVNQVERKPSQLQRCNGRGPS